MINDEWDQRFLELAQHIASWSKDPSTKVGAVIVRPNRTIASVGYNGFPRRVDDSPESYANRDIKYRRVVHAEMNAILVASENLAGYSLYVFGLPPCSTCAGAIIQSGILRVRAIGHDLSRWKDHMDDTTAMFSDAGIDFKYQYRGKS